MERTERSETIQQLKQDGFKMVTGFAYLYINPTGKVFNLNTGRYLKPTKRNHIKPGNKYLSLPKLILQAFSNQSYRTGHIQYIDGNKNNLTPENLKYNRIFAPNHEPQTVNPEMLLFAIRCYIEVDSKYTINDKFKTRMYLRLIVNSRLFFVYKSELQHVEVFKTYIEGNNIAQTAINHRLSIRDCTAIVNLFQNLLIAEILHDLANNVLSLKPFNAKKPTKTQLLKEYNKDLIQRGVKPLPLRKKSLKEQIRAFEKQLSEFKAI